MDTKKMSGEKRKKEDEIDEQKNKSHRGLNKKLKKRRKHEKEVKKDKSQKKKDYAEKRDKYREKYFAQSQKQKSKNDKDKKGIKIFKLQKALKKFLEIYEDDIEDFKSIFSSLDEGEEIEIQDIENPKIRKYISKIFKYLKAKQKSGKQGFRKSAKTDFSLSTYMNNIINDCMTAASKKDESGDDDDLKNNESGNDKRDDDSDSSSDDEDEEEIKKKPIKKVKKNSDDEDSEDDGDDLDSNSDDEDSDNEKTNQKAQSQKEQARKLGPQLPSVIGPSIPSQIGPIGPQVGPSLISQEEKEKFLTSALSQDTKKEQSNWMGQGDLDSFLNDAFKEVEASNVKKFLQNKKVVNEPKRSGQTLDSSRLAPGSAPIDLEHILIDETQDKKAIEYEEKYRNKSLMEIHHENLMKKKTEAGKDTFRKPFDRNEDLVIKKTDSKKLLAAIKDSFQHGPKFQPAKN